MDKLFWGGGVSKKAKRPNPTSRNERRKAISAKRAQEHPLENLEVQEAVTDAIIDYEDWKEAVWNVGEPCR